MRAKLGTCAVVLLMLGSFSFLLVEEAGYQESLHHQELRENIRRQAVQKLEVIKRSSSPRLQIQNLLLDFQQSIPGLFQQGKPEDLRTALLRGHQRLLPQSFPRHDWFLAEASLRRPVVFGQMGNLGLDESLAGALAQVTLDQHFAREHTDRVERRLAEVIQFPLKLPHIFDPSMNQTLQSTVSTGGVFGTFYGFLELGGKRHLLFFLIDLRDLPVTSGVKLTADSWREPFSGVAFWKPETRDLICSSLFSRRPALKTFLRQRAAKGFRFTEGEQVGRLLFFPEPVPSPNAFHPVVAFDLRAFPNPSFFSRSAAIGLALLAICLIMFFVVENVVFQRGLRTGLRFALLLTFLMVAILPGAGVFVFSLRTREEFAKKSIQEVARELHQEIARLDEGLEIYHGNFIQKVLTTCNNPEAIAQIVHEELGHPLASPGATLEHMAQAIGLGSLSSRSDLVNNLMSVVGPGGFSQSWNANASPETLGEQDNMMKLMGPLGRANLREFNPDLTGAPPAPGKESRESMDGIVIESLLDALKSMASPELFLRTIYYPEEIQEFRSLTGRAYYIQLPLIFERAVRYILFIFWDQSLLDRPYLQKTLTAAEGDNESQQHLFATGVNLHMSPEIIPPHVASFPRLVDLMERSRVAKNTARLTFPEEHLVLEATPGFYANQYLLAGQKDASAAFLKGSRRLWLLQLGVLLEIILSLMAAFMGARYFLQPLLHLIGGLAEVDRGNFDVRLDASRPDEFGSLAQAFNQMTGKLQEGQILGKYVPSAVLRALTDPEFKARAQEGENLQVTVVFSGFAEMEQYQRFTDPTGVLRVLDQHFNAAQLAAEKFGGEIDKVIGEKILIVFEHRRLGGGARAAELACQVIEFMKEYLGEEGCPLEIAAGINTGPVIAGFLGASNLRQEYTFIGDTVNVASRLLSVAPSLGGSRVIVSGTTRQEMTDTSRLRKLPLVQVKGKSQKVDAYILE